MTFKCCCYFILFTFSTSCFSQKSGIDTIPFSLSKKLLVFKGSINGVAVDFAFDTGAGMGVANSAIQKHVTLDVKNSKKSITDANMQTVKLQNISIKKIRIGSFELNNIKSILHDMEYLQCNELYLLGMDVIGKLNWLINFQEKTIFVSERPFVVDSNYTALPIKYKNNRPVTTVTIGIHSQRNCLLDFGFTGTIELPESPNINHYFSEKQQAGFTAIGLSSTMALSGLGKPDTVKYMKMDSVIFGGRQFGNVPVTIIEKTEPKIGVGFFSNYCTQLLLNHSNEAYYFIPTPNPSVSLDNFDARVTFRNGKLFITAKNLRANSSALSLSIEEEIKSVDGKRAVDFSDNCTFLNSFYLNNAAEVVIEKLTGEKLSIKRQQVK